MLSSLKTSTAAIPGWMQAYDKAKITLPYVVHFKCMFVLQLYPSGNLQEYMQYKIMKPKGRDSVELDRCLS